MISVENVKDNFTPGTLPQIRYGPENIKYAMTSIINFCEKNEQNQFVRYLISIRNVKGCLCPSNLPLIRALNLHKLYLLYMIYVKLELLTYFKLNNFPNN